MVGLAHGSRHVRVADGVDAVLDATAALTGTSTRSAYLDLTAPDLKAVAVDLAAAGERTAVVVPLLFTDAFHARTDVPAAVAEAARASGLELTLSTILGTGDDVLDVVDARLTAAASNPGEPVLLYAVGSSQPGANETVIGLADRLAVRRAAPVRAGFATSEPRLADVLTGLRELSERPGTVVPLFVAPGLLLDAIASPVAEVGWRLAEPLGTLLAPVVGHRYSAAVRDVGRLR